MKPFDLEAALQGEPVQLRNGDKGIICYKVLMSIFMLMVTPLIIL